jgi:hypothetical protein
MIAPFSFLQTIAASGGGGGNIVTQLPLGTISQYINTFGNGNRSYTWFTAIGYDEYNDKVVAFDNGTSTSSSTAYLYDGDSDGDDGNRKLPSSLPLNGKMVISIDFDLNGNMYLATVEKMFKVDNFIANGTSSTWTYMFDIPTMENFVSFGYDVETDHFYFCNNYYIWYRDDGPGFPWPSGPNIPYAKFYKTDSSGNLLYTRYSGVPGQQLGVIFGIKVRGNHIIVQNAGDGNLQFREASTFNQAPLAPHYTSAFLTNLGGDIAYDFNRKRAYYMRTGFGQNQLIRVNFNY